MRQKNLLLKLWGLLVLTGLFSSTAKAQVIDSTGVFDPKLTGTEIVYAALVYNDLGTVGNMDAGFCLVGKADGSQIAAFTEYNAGIAFYADGLKVRNGGTTGGWVADNVIPSVSGQLYHVWFVLDNVNKKYKVYVKTNGLYSATLVSNLDLDYRYGTSEINRWTAFHNAEPDKVTVQYVATNLAVDQLPASFFDANLKSLVPSVGTLNTTFDPATTSYTLTVPFGTTSVDFAAIANGVGATVSGNTGVLVEDGWGYAEIVVTAGNGDQNQYNIEIIQAGSESEASIKSITLSAGTLKPTFNRDVLNYEAWLPYGTTSVLVEATPFVGGAVVTGDGNINLVDGAATATISSTSVDKTVTKTYTVHIYETPLNLIEKWDGDGATGTGSEPSSFGWAATNVTSWGTANGSGIRYTDQTSGWTYNSAAWTGRTLYDRWDGVGASTVATVYSFPVQLEACKSYTFKGKYGWPNNSTSPTYVFGINSSADNLGTVVATKSYTVATKGNVLYDMSFDFTAPATGKYYLTIACNTAVLGAVADLWITENTQKAVTSSTASVTFSDNAKSATFTIYGNKLSENITLTAPAGITLEPSTISFADSQCGVNVTATYNYSTNVTSGNITATSSSQTKNIAFTYVPPTLSVYETSCEVEDNGKSYPLTVKSLNQSIESLQVTASEGFSVSPATVSAADFAAGSGSVAINISSTAAVGAMGTITFKSGTNELATVAVKKVAAHTRYYIKQKVSNYYIGNHTTGLYPALTEAASANSQQFFMREVAPGVFYIVQDDTYRVIRKVASSTWDTEFGIPSNEAKWTIQNDYQGFATITNVVTGKLFGSDTPAADARIYDDKAYVADGNMEWIFSNVATGTSGSNSKLANLALNVGSISPAFDALTNSYTANLPAGTTSVKPIAVPADFGSYISGAAAVDVTSGNGASTIVVTAPNGIDQTTYTVTYSVATKVNSAKANNATVFPTMSKGNFTVKTDGASTTITVIDLTGKVISKQTATGTEQTVSVNNAGIYLLKVESATGTKMVKVVVTK